MNRLVSATEKLNAICKGRRQKVDTHLLQPRRDSERISVRICKNPIFAKTHRAFLAKRSKSLYPHQKAARNLFCIKNGGAKLCAAVILFYLIICPYRRNGNYTPSTQSLYSASLLCRKNPVPFSKR